MDDPLAVERDELLKMIGELERLHAGLQDVNAGVSNSRISELQQLRKQVEQTRSPTKLQWAWTVAQEVLKVVAAELMKRLIETLSCLFAAVALRRCSYDEGWRLHQVFAQLRWTFAARVSAPGGDLRIHALAG